MLSPGLLGAPISPCAGVPGPNASPVLTQHIPSAPLSPWRKPCKKRPTQASAQSKTVSSGSRWSLEPHKCVCFLLPSLSRKARQCPLSGEGPLGFRKGSQPPRAYGAHGDYGARRALGRQAACGVLRPGPTAGSGVPETPGQGPLSWQRGVGPLSGPGSTHLDEFWDWK